MIGLAIIFGLTLIGLIVWCELRVRRLEDQGRVERRELTDRIMALSSKPESLVAVHRDEAPASLKVVGDDQPWHEVTE